MLRHLSFAVVLAAVFSLGFGEARANAQNSVAVLDIVGSGVDAQLLPTLTEILTAEIADLGSYRVVGSRDIQAMLGFEQQKDVVGCTDASCLAEIGGALGVERIVASQIGRVGSTYVVNIKLINIKSAATEARVYETVKGADDVLIDTVRKSVFKLFGAGGAAARQAASEQKSAPQPTKVAEEQAPAAPTSTETSAAPAVATQQEVKGGSSTPIAPFILMGAGGVGILSGALIGNAAKGQANTAETRRPGSQLEAEKAEKNAARANLFIGLGSLCVAGGVVWWLLSGDDAPADKAAFLPIVAADQVGLAFSTGF